MTISFSVHMTILWLLVSSNPWFGQALMSRTSACNRMMIGSSWLGNPSTSFQCSDFTGKVVSALSASLEPSNQDMIPMGSSVSGLVSHHVAVKTRNITVAIQFYSLLGFEVESKFRAGPAKAAWLRQGSCSRIELIEVPSYMLNEPEGMKRRAFDLMKREELLGWNHLALDVTDAIREKQQQASDESMYQLQEWIRDLNATSIESFGKSLIVALEPTQQIIGGSVYELAFIYDADGAMVEFLNYQTDLAQSIDSGWEPWSGDGFVSGKS